MKGSWFDRHEMLGCFLAFLLYLPVQFVCMCIFGAVVIGIGYGTFLLIFWVLGHLGQLIR